MNSYSCEEQPQSWFLFLLIREPVVFSRIVKKAAKR